MSSSSLFRSSARAVLAFVATVAVLAGVLVGLPGPASAAEPPTDGLVLRYDFDQAGGTTVQDASGNGRDGTILGGATSTAARASRSTAPTTTSSCRTTCSPA